MSISHMAAFTANITAAIPVRAAQLPHCSLVKRKLTGFKATAQSG